MPWREGRVVSEVIVSRVRDRYLSEGVYCVWLEKPQRGKNHKRKLSWRGACSIRARGRRNGSWRSTRQRAAMGKTATTMGMGMGIGMGMEMEMMVGAMGMARGPERKQRRGRGKQRGGKEQNRHLLTHSKLLPPNLTSLTLQVAAVVVPVPVGRCGACPPHPPLVHPGHPRQARSARQSNGVYKTVHCAKMPNLALFLYCCLCCSKSVLISCYKSVLKRFTFRIRSLLERNFGAAWTPASFFAKNEVRILQNPPNAKFPGPMPGAKKRPLGGKPTKSCRSNSPHWKLEQKF